MADDLKTSFLYKLTNGTYKLFYIFRITPLVHGQTCKIRAATDSITTDTCTKKIKIFREFRSSAVN